MRLAVLLDNWNSMGGGLEQYLTHLIPALAEAKHDILFVAEKANICPPRGCQTVSLGKKNFFPRPWREALNEKEAIKKIKGWQPDAVITLRTLSYPGAYHMPIGGSPRHIPKKKAPSYRTKKLIAREEKAMHSAKVILPNSNFVGEQIKSYCSTPQKIITLPLLEKLEKRNLKRKTTSALAIAHCGRDHWRHGLPEAIKWFSTIKLAYKNSKLTCYVKSIPKACKFLKEDVKSLAEKGIQLCKWGKNFRQEINKFDLLLHPSKYDSFSLVCLEAVAAKVPVLCSNTTGVAQFLPKSICQSIPLKESDEAIIKTVKELLTSSSTDVSEIEKIFSLPKHIKKIEELLS